MKLALYFSACFTLAAATALKNDVNLKNLRTALIPKITDPRIVGGSNSIIERHPHQVSLRYKSILYPDNSYNHNCGGSILSERVIVTAAHCIVSTVASQYNIVAGTTERRGTGYIAPVQDIIRHENYNPENYDNDVAIVITGTPLPLNNFNMRAIELADEGPYQHETATITGWGRLQSGGTSPALLQEVQVPIVSNELCNQDYEGRIKESMICAGLRNVGGKDSCQGDSGGPLVVNKKLAGIVSWGFGCARPDYPGVYAKVSHLRSWILEKAAPYM